MAKWPPCELLRERLRAVFESNISPHLEEAKRTLSQLILQPEPAAHRSCVMIHTNVNDRPQRLYLPALLAS